VAISPYARDEDLVIAAKSDWTLLSEPLQRLAAGLDGAIGSPDAWLFTSNSGDFAAQGIAPGHVIRLPERGKFKLGGSARGLFAVDDIIDATTLRLRPLGGSPGSGWSPQPAGTAGLEFVVDSANAQIAQASEEVDLWLRTDPAAPEVYPPDVVSVADYRRLATWLGLSDIYLGAAREGDPNRDTFLRKAGEYRKFATDYFARIMAKVAAVFGASGGLPVVGQLTADIGEAFDVRGSQPAVLGKDGTIRRPQPYYGWGWPR
jgi:hypothetical protein